MLVFLASFATLLCLLYVSLKWRYSYWKDRGVPSPRPTMFVGNLGPSLTSETNAGEIYCEIYRKYPGYRYVGFYRFMNPALLLRDPELIKDVLVKDFHSFAKNDFEATEKQDPIMGRNPFTLSGEKWKVVRSQWTPNFTTGKMKQVFPFLKEQSALLTDYMEKRKSCVDVKDLLKRYTTGNVASCAFGLDANTFDENESEFVKVARETGDLSPFSMIKMILICIFPVLGNILTVRFISKEAENYLMNVVKETLEYRRKNNVVRNDFLDTMAEQKLNCKQYKFEDIDIVAQASGFFGDGVESSAVVMSYIVYDLAKNPEVQKNLHQEIQDVLNKYGAFTYENINEMKYLDGVINESMRVHPAMYALTKKCTEDYDLPPVKDGGARVRIPKGTSVILPVEAVHMDAANFPDPETFDPLRFSSENKGNIRKCTFLPFGDGPRVCLGMRFGVLQIKMGLAAMLAKYSISVNAKTAEPLQYIPNSIMRLPIGGIWVDFQKR